MRSVIKLTNEFGNTILLGVDSIISVKEIKVCANKSLIGLTEIDSRHAMVTTNYVIESVEEIYKLIEG